MKRLGMGGMAIESCTFSPLRTERADFQEVYRGDALRVRYPFLAAEFAGRRDVAWLPLFHARALPGGVVRGDVYAALKAELLAGVAGALPLDGFFLDVHGAMAVEGVDDPEADLAAAIRQCVGPACVIAASSDLHGNITPELLRHVDLITAYRTAPHEDVLETRARACRLLLHALDTGARPQRAWVGIPVLVSGERSSTRAEPAASLYRELDEAGRQPGVLDASLWVGYVWADTPRSMAACVVTGTRADVIRAQAERLALRYWEARERFQFSVPAGPAPWCFEEALRRPERPVFISDSGDNPTAGGAGDVPACLDAALRTADFRDGRAEAIYASMPDAQAVAQCFAAGEGAPVSLSLGGKLDPVHGQPLPVEGRVRRLLASDPVGGRLAVVQSGGVAIIVTERRKPFHHMADFRALGLDPAAAKVVVVKIGYLEPELHACARHALLALTPGAVNQDIASLPYRRLRRPMFPLDRAFAWQPQATVVG